MSDNPTSESNERLEKLLSLPSDWWQTVRASSTLVQAFKRHIVPLLIAGRVEQETQFNLYTGILLKVGQTIVWLTAGHVVDEVIQFRSSSSLKLETMTWVDGYDVANAGSVPWHRYDVPMKSWTEKGLDLGVIVPSLLDVQNLLSNQNVKPIDAKIWQSLKQASPEGYYAIGYPRPWSKHTQAPAPNNKLLNSVKADLACLPLEPILPPEDFSYDVKWSDPNAFYGRLLPFKDYPEFELEDAKGMSGGPILSVERDSNGQIRYRLVGIIQSFARSQSIFRAEPIHKIAEAIDAWLEP